MKTIITSLKELHTLMPIEAKAVFVMPFIDLEQASVATNIFSKRANSSEGILIAVNDIHRVGFINIANHIFQLTTSELFGYLASDAFPCRRWLDYSLSVFSNNEIGLLAYNDGKWLGQLAGFGLVRRSWISNYYRKNIFFPGYKQHYCDTELSILAHATGKHGYNANIVIMEVDYQKDTKNVNINDKLLFQDRMEILKKSYKWQNPSAFNMFKQN